ncbi:MAG: hypothetical protein ABH843_01825 [Candidatus Omnitrophota bacterium]
MKNKQRLVLNLILAIFLPSIILLSSDLSHATEVEAIEDSQIPPELEKTIEIKKAGDLKVMPIVDITALGTWSKLEGGDALGGVNVRGTIAPVMRIDKNNFLIPLYYGGYNRERQVIVEEEGGRIYNEIMDHNATVEYKHIIDEKTSIKTDALARVHYVKEKGYGWNDGLYDYRDFGAGASLEYFFEKSKEARSSISGGGEYYHREYPNYISLIALASVTAPEKDEKNYNGFRPIVRYKYITEKMNCGLFYSPLYKDYDDKKVIDSNGVLGSEERKDWFHYITGDFSYTLENVPIILGIGVTGIIVESNQNYYDSRGTVTLADDVYTGDYYDFSSIDINPKITYMRKVKEYKEPATLTLGYAYTRRDYNDRKVQLIDSTYTTDTQMDKLHTINTQATYPLTDNISFVASGSYTNADSNMKYETYYTYTYDIYSAAAGIRIKY